MKPKVDPFKQKIVEVALENAQREEAAAVKKTAAASLSDVDLKSLLELSLLGIHREVTNIVRATAEGILDKDHSDALIKYTTLLTKLVKEENELLDKLSEDQLTTLVK